MATVGARLAAVTRAVAHRTPAWRSVLGARSLTTPPTGSAAQPALASERREEPQAVPSGTAGPTVASLSDDEVFSMVASGQLKAHNLEKVLGDRTRAVTLRRRFVAHEAARSGTSSAPGAGMDALPHDSFDSAAFYDAVDGSNCENVIGYLPLPVGVVGPMNIDGRDYMVPMATTEGALVASTNRGARAISKSGGVRTALTGDGMTRAPLLRMPSIAAAAELKLWAEDPENARLVADTFASTSRFGRLQSLVVMTAGRNAYLRFKCSTGDAMGMNMITKGVNAALAVVVERFPTARVLSLSGNVCTDKKPSAINWIDGRGKSVTAEVVLPRSVVEGTLKTTADRLVELNLGKNLVGSAMAGSIGGFNAHAANIVSAVFLATGQDPAQNVESSTCLTLIEHDDDPENKGGIIASVTMPSIEVGTVGGGTSLTSQAACLDLLGLRGAAPEPLAPGAHSAQLARVVAASVLAGELSLMAAHTTGDLLRAHMELNRKPSAGDAQPGATGGSAPASSARSRMAAPSHGLAAVQGGAGSFRHPEAGPAIPGRRYFAAAHHRAPAAPLGPARAAPVGLSRASTPITADSCPVLRGV